MPTITTPRRWAWYHVVLHIVGAILAVGAIVCLVLMFIYPEHPVIRSVAIVSACMAGIVTAAAAVHRAVYEIGQAVTARLDATEPPDLDARLADLRDEMEGMIAAALVTGLRAQEGGVNGSTIVPFTRRN